MTEEEKKQEGIRLLRIVYDNFLKTGDNFIDTREVLRQFGVPESEIEPIIQRRNYPKFMKITDQGIEKIMKACN